MGFSTDLTEKQWKAIESIFKSNKGQHFVEHTKRDLVNAVLYLVKTGCRWRLIPNDFPPYATVWSFYRRAVKSGKWEKAMDLLVKKPVKAQGASPAQHTGLSIRKAQKQHQLPMTGASTAGKKIKGRKRHIVVDTMGNLLAVSVHAANIHDRKSGISPAKKTFDCDTKARGRRI
jgi:putative transposase